VQVKIARGPEGQAATLYVGHFASFNRETVKTRSWPVSECEPRAKIALDLGGPALTFAVVLAQVLWKIVSVSTAADRSTTHGSATRSFASFRYR
jgi:hypothetical protein